MKNRNSAPITMTEGPLLINLLKFSYPLILTGILQLLFNAADIVVVGKYAGTQALAAVGSTGALINLLVNVFMGLAVGASVVVAQRYGAQDYKGVQDTVHTSILAATLCGVFVMLLGFFLSRPLLQLMKSPDDVIDGATLYMQIFFLGMPFNMLYNFGAAIMRAVGDTKRPLYFLTFAGVINVILNLILVIVFHLDVAGVAIATVVSQMISMVLVLHSLRHANTCVRLDFKKLKIHKQKLFQIIRVGLPAGIQGSIFSISNVLIQSAINSFGSIVMAGNAAAANIEGFIYTTMNAVYQADMTFTGQNVGARKPERLDKILRSSVFLVSMFGIVLSLIVVSFGSFFVGIYDKDPEVIKMGILRLELICSLYFTCGIMDVMVGHMRGMGYSILPMIVSLVCVCGFRIAWIYTVFVQHHTLQMLYISYPISWILTALIHFVTFLFIRKKVKAKLLKA